MRSPKRLCRLALAAPVALTLMGALPSAAQSLRKDLTEGMSEHSPPAELFLRAYEVFSHPRCANCHPADDRPRWGAPVHGMNVQRGWEQLSNGGDVLPGGYGRPGMPCETCHQSANGALPGSPPGAQNWRLAPSSMGWSGLTAHELCTRLTLAGRKDGGQQAVDALAHILTPGKVDPLVAWAWEPGLGRDPAPGTLDQFIEILRWWKWVGAACPERGG